jgi:hypothetical protein
VYFNIKGGGGSSYGDGGGGYGGAALAEGVDLVAAEEDLNPI